MTKDNFYSQFGEDKILHNVFSKKNRGTCVEVGGYDGISGSNTYFFETIGWKCLILEPIPELCEKIRLNRNCDILQVAASDKIGISDFYIAKGVESLSTIETEIKHFDRIYKDGGSGIEQIKVKTDLLTNILKINGYTEIDFLTLDVEGHEMSALRGLDFDKINIKILIIEDATFGKSNDIKNFMRANSFVRFKRTGCNDWYARKESNFFNIFSVFLIEFEIYLILQFKKIKSLIKKLYLKHFKDN
jgi:FkbM family methyltransferase